MSRRRQFAPRTDPEGAPDPEPEAAKAEFTGSHYTGCTESTN